LILSSSFLAFSQKDGLYDWEAALKNLTKIRFRRADRFSLAVLCGAISCLEQNAAAKEFALYFGTSNGSVESVKNSQDNIFLQNQFPLPFTFINTLSSTPLFFLLQYLNAQTTAMSIAHSQFAFENALNLALIDLKQKRIKRALVGVCDIWYEPLAQACQILDHEAYEFSAWIFLQYNKRDQVRFFGEFSELFEFVKQFNKASFYISPNFPLDEYNKLKEVIQIRRNNVAKTITNYSAAIACSHFAAYKMPLFYIGYDDRGGYSFININ
jgi:hypothetical protein